MKNLSAARETLVRRALWLRSQIRRHPSMRQAGSIYVARLAEVRASLRAMRGSK